ncbi:hypothetical protein OIU76_020321 [Salix suchowensis]|nr:hypothetical protein OIU76_020321 [Salix suchowensis]
MFIKYVVIQKMKVSILIKSNFLLLPCDLQNGKTYNGGKSFQDYWLSSTIYEYGNKDDVPFKAFIVTTRLLCVLLAVVPGSIASNCDGCLFHMQLISNHNQPLSFSTIIKILVTSSYVCPGFLHDFVPNLHQIISLSALLYFHPRCHLLLL